MTKEKKLLCEESLRHTEYYGLQSVFDELYAKSKNGEEFTELMPLILSRENILLAYRNIKTNTGSNTPGTDKLTIGDIGQLSPEEVVNNVRRFVQGSPHGYRPKPVRRKDIPKPHDPTKTRPLGIPCIWDRLIQQCVKQVLEPICEAKFSNNSYGFRPNRSAEHAIAATVQKMQLANLHYVIEFDIKGFFDNVNHSKLMRQIWAMGIHDKHLIYVLRKMLTASIKMPDGTTVTSDRGTPQGGIVSPLLANIVLNELDHWVDSQWLENPVCAKYARLQKDGYLNRGHGYRAMRNTQLKEMYIVRYADDFRIFCRTRADAELTKTAVMQFIEERLKLEVSQEKTKIVNVMHHYSDFLGFKLKVHPKGKRQVVQSHMSDKSLKAARDKLTKQAKQIAKPRPHRKEYGEVVLYNEMVMGIQNYYQIATNVNLDCDMLLRAVMTVLTNRLTRDKGNRLIRTGRKLTDYERERYGNTAMWRYVAGSEEPIYPIGKISHRNPMCKKLSVCRYTADGRKEQHDNLRVNVALMLALMRQPLYERSAEYADNRISHFTAQWGKCAITDRAFQTTAEIHCHHIIPRSQGGSDKYDNLVLVTNDIHRLIHAVDPDTIRRYQISLQLNKEQLAKLKKYREQASLSPVT